MLISVTHAAKELGLSLKTARSKIRSGDWPTYRFGSKSTRLDLAEIKALARRPERKTSIDGEKAR